MYTLGINAAFHDSAACLVGDGRVVAAAEEERFTHDQARQAAGAVLDLGAAVPRDRLLPAARPGSTWPTSTTSPTRTTRTCCWAGTRDDATITLPLEAERHPTPAEWESAWDPLFLSSIVNAPRQLADGAPHHLAGAVPRRAGPTARSAGTSSRTTWRTRPAPSTPRRSSARPS